MKQKIIALLLILALTLSLCAGAAFAEEGAETEEQPAAETEEAAETEDAADAEDAEDGEAEEEAPSLAGPDAAPEVDPETGEPLTDAAAAEPDELGTVSFANVESRMRENNLQVLILEESVQSIEDIDYDDLYEDLRQQLNTLAKTQWGLVMMSPEALSYAGMSEFDRDKSYDQLDAAYDAVREQFDAIKDGEMQEDNAAIVRQLKNLQDQIIVAGESTYVALTAMETQEAALQRQLTALDRTVEEMELRYQLGQISALQLSQTKAGRASLASGLETLRMNIQTYKYQLEMLLGAEQTGEIRLGPVPEVTDKQLAAMDLEADLLAAKERSYELYDAERTLEDAKEDFKDNYSYGSTTLKSKQALHTWNAAQYTYENTVQNYELRFRALYAQVTDCKQILDAARISLACEQASYAASELKYQQGTISHNALLDAEDSLRAAEDTVKTAANDLFSTYNTYCWAVQNGILN